MKRHNLSWTSNENSLNSWFSLFFLYFQCPKQPFQICQNPLKMPSILSGGVTGSHQLSFDWLIEILGKWKTFTSFQNSSSIDSLEKSFINFLLLANRKQWSVVWVRSIIIHVHSHLSFFHVQSICIICCSIL